MTRGAAISIALLALIALVLIMLLAWPTHSARSRETGEPLTKWIDGNGCANGSHEGGPDAPQT
jgi:hypothetical protein